MSSREQTQRLHLSIADGGLPISGIMSTSPRLSQAVTTPPGSGISTPPFVHTVRPDSSTSYTASYAPSETNAAKPPSDMETIP